jgi:4-carboxymuconolactone decarboxylase
MAAVRGVLGLAVVAMVAVAAGFETGAQPLPVESIQLRGDRFRGLHYREMTPEQQAMLYNVVNSARAVTNTTGNGPFNTLLRSPEIGDLSQQLGNAIRFSSGLSGRLREIATLMAGVPDLDYEWYAHARYAADEGIAADVIERSRRRMPDLAAMPVEDAMVWRVADEILSTRRVTDATFGEALAVLGERRLLSAATIAAYYEYVSMLLNVDRYPLPADAPQDAARAAHSLRRLSAEELYRMPAGPVTPRPEIPNADTERAIAALGAAVDRDDELPRHARDAARSAVLRQWNRTPPTADGGIAYRFATELLDTRQVTDATFAAAMNAFGERQLVNLMVLMGHSNIRCAQLAR